MAWVGKALKRYAVVASCHHQKPVGVQLALPIVAVLLMTNIMLAVLTRSAPQMKIFAIGFPNTLGLGLLVLDLALPYYPDDPGLCSCLRWTPFNT
jgi:flagellar biosynthesis protein FliR